MEHANVTQHREKLAEVARTTQSALLRRLMRMIATMDFEDWIVHALEIMTENNASLPRDLMRKAPQNAPPRSNYWRLRNQSRYREGLKLPCTQRQLLMMRG